jgi:hypothetical protein
MLIEQVKDILERLCEKNIGFDSSELRILRNDVRYYQEIIARGLILLRKIGEADIYLEHSHESKEARDLLTEVMQCDDGGESILKEIKLKAEAVLVHAGVRRKDYKTLRAWLIRRTDGIPSGELLQALHQLETLEAREQALQTRKKAWYEIRDQQSSYYSEIRDQLKADRDKVDEDLKYWRKISGVVAITLMILTVGSIAFILISREPLATLTSLPALLVGIVEPIILIQYNKALKMSAKKNGDVVDQVNLHHHEEYKQLRELFGTMSDDFQPLSSVSEGPRLPDPDLFVTMIGEYDVPNLKSDIQK